MTRWSVEPLLLTSARLSTFRQGQILTGASGFFFRRDDRLFLVTSRHVLIDEASEHFPDRIQIELHVDASDLAKSTGFSMPLYHDWSQRGGRAPMRPARSTSPSSRSMRAALPSPRPLPRLRRPPICTTRSRNDVEAGSSILVVGFPLGFHDTLHHLPVVRQAGIASSFGLRFQGEGFFLTDVRTHRGASGAPVVTRAQTAEGHAVSPVLPWR